MVEDAMSTIQRDKDLIFTLDYFIKFRLKSLISYREMASQRPIPGYWLGDKKFYSNYESEVAKLLLKVKLEVLERML